MTIDRRTLLATPLLAAAAPALAAAAPREPDASYPLWPGEAPGLVKPDLAERTIERGTPAIPDRAVLGIRAPRIAAFHPARPTGAAMLVIPGGGYERVVVDKEGREIAAWLTAHGVAAFVLYYRLPAEGWRDPTNTPLADAQRAMRLIRANAARWRVDPARLGVMGFSAGGHLCADLATRFGRQVYAPVDAADREDARPAIAAPIYPVISMDPAIAHAGSRAKLIGADATDTMEAEHSPDRQVTKATPPCFLAHAEDDAAVPVANSLAMRAALKAAGVPVETHLFESGGHGFGWGRRIEGKGVHLWPELWLAFARAHGVVG